VPGDGTDVELANRHPRTDPRLLPALASARQAIAASNSRWRSRVLHVLATRRFGLRRLEGMAGFNPFGPLLPVIYIDESFFQRASTEQMTRVLLHEALHQCFVVLPEWKLWINWLALTLRPRAEWKNKHYPLIAHKDIYGVGVNSADTIVAELLSTNGQTQA
jgi:hypothetical protein